jgi:YesN/AraC family two-component response regulator
MDTRSPILVVDDEKDIPDLFQMKFRRQIRNQELCFMFAQNGKEALDVLRQHPEISVALVDINMPVMDGLAMLNEIHQEDYIGQTFQFVKIVIITAYNDMENIRRAMNYGAFDFLTKPLDFKDLEITIKKTFYEVGKLRELDRQRKEELKKRIEAEQILQGVDKSQLYKIIEENV